MKKLFFALFIMLLLPLGMECGILNEASIRVIIHRPATSGNNHIIEPVAYYYPVSKILTIEFPAEDFEPYTLSVSSDDVTLNYTVTSPLYRVYVPTDVVEVDLQLETDSGDIFYGSFDATGGTMI